MFHNIPLIISLLPLRWKREPFLREYFSSPAFPAESGVGIVTDTIFFRLNTYFSWLKWHFTMLKRDLAETDTAARADAAASVS